MNNKVLKISSFICFVLLVYFDCKTNDSSVDSSIELFFTAIGNNEIENVKNLIANGIDVNSQNFKGVFGLFCAHNVEMVQLLIDSGADVNMQPSEYGFTALMSAVMLKDDKIVEILLAAGANVHLKRYDGTTAFSLAVIMSHCFLNINYDAYTKIQLALIRAGADVNTCFKNNRTALMYAVDRGQGEVVKALITAGANIHVVDDFGNSALSLAYEYNHLDIAHILLKAGATKEDIYHSNIFPMFIINAVRFLRYGTL